MRPRLFRVLLAGTALAFMLAVTRVSPRPAPQRALRLVAVGDILLGDAAQKKLDRHGYDYPFHHLRAYLQKADVVVGNLEGPITKHTVRLGPDKAWSYKSAPAAAAALEKVGFTALCLANNHTMDYGPRGMTDTIRFLDKHGLGNTVRHSSCC
jgi:poly-gamma-glutamate capsule biosynthesis protein CapA/YwtB (metallophosphatase superfamily)